MPGMVQRLRSTGPLGGGLESRMRNRKDPKSLQFVANSYVATVAKIQVQLI